MILAEYFLPLKDPEHYMDWEIVRRILRFHDMAEIATGEIISLKRCAG